MPRNIEIKARLRDAAELAAVAQRAAALATAPPAWLDQDDTFFAVPHGRLKLRRFADGTAELIHYHRDDDPASRASDYVRVAVPDADALQAALARGCGLAGRVRKRRQLFLAGATRIHLDMVEGLGPFLELEVVLADGQDDASGHAEAGRVLAALGAAQAPRVAVAYRDLLAGMVA
ncbi:MAG: class IV adenylate cyclase [Aquabacterium sp.]